MKNRGDIMTIDRFYFEEHNFVLTLIYGKLTNTELLEHVQAMNQEYSEISGIKELADCRFLHDVSELSGADLLSTADLEKGTTRVIGGKGAIVASSDAVFGLASMYAAIASNIREDSKAFRNLEESIEFLELGDFRKEILSLISDSAYKKRLNSVM